MEKFIVKMERLIQQLSQNNILYIKFQYSTYAIFKTSKGKFHIKYYNPPTSYITRTKTIYYPGTFINEVHSLTIKKTINWFIKNWKFALSDAKFYFQ